MSVELKIKIELRKMRTPILFVNECAASAVLKYFSFFSSKCTSTFHAAFTYPIQMITSKKVPFAFSCRYFSLTLVRSFHPFSLLFLCKTAARARAHHTHIFFFPIFMSSIMLSVVWQSLLLAKTKCDFKFD